MYCPSCGSEVSDTNNFCPNCGSQLGVNQYEEESYYKEPNFEKPEEVEAKKSRVVAGLLQIFLGGFGIGRFYLGYTGMGIAQLLTAFLCGIGWIWGFIDGILILCGQVNMDADGNPLKD